jgi:hypothetical protein
LLSKLHANKHRFHQQNIEKSGETSNRTCKNQEPPFLLIKKPTWTMDPVGTVVLRLEPSVGG